MCYRVLVVAVRRPESLSVVGCALYVKIENRESESPRTERAAVRLVSTLRVGKPCYAGGKPDYVRGANCFAGD